jgi:hypothetical protein
MAYPQATINMSKGMTQEQMWREVVEAPMPQPGITSVVVEHGTGENIPESQPQPSLGDDFSERISPPAKHDEPPALPRTLPSTPAKDMTILPDNVPMPSSKQEQQLEFLRYLVQQGVINEGFAEGRFPRNIRLKRKNRLSQHPREQSMSHLAACQHHMEAG